MGSINICFLRNCFIDEQDDSEDEQVNSSQSIPVTNNNNNSNTDIQNILDHHHLSTPAIAAQRMMTSQRRVDSHTINDSTATNSNLLNATISSSNEPPSQNSIPSTGNDINTTCRHPSSNVSNDHDYHNFLGFFRRLGIGRHNTNIRHNNDNSNTTSSTTSIIPIAKEINSSPNKQLQPFGSPLIEAKNFINHKSMDDIPSLALDEVVIPGSELQKNMSDSLKLKGYTAEATEDECVICMEGFDETNPRMPTLCGCGENKTFFHLPCLYQWIEQQGGSTKCPSCRKNLRWEEF